MQAVCRESGNEPQKPPCFNGSNSLSISRFPRHWMQVCKNCNTSNPVDNYYLDKRYNTRSQTCNACKAKAKRETRKKDPEKYQEYQRLYRNVTRESFNTYMVKYRAEHPDYAKEQNYKYYYEKGGQEKNREYRKKVIHITREKERERYKKDVQFKLKKVLRTRVNKFVKQKTLHSSTLLDCDTTFYKKYLEIQFSEHMNWDNYGIYWNIDHVIPCAHFDLEIPENQKLCFHWSNTRPLIKSENESKNDLIIKDDILKHADFLKTISNKIQYTIPSYSRKGLMAQISKLGYGNNSSDVTDIKSV